MLFAIARRDKPGMGDKRAELLAAHAEYQKAFMPADHLRRWTGRRRNGCRQFRLRRRGHHGSSPGNVLVLDVPDRAAAEAMHANDPYTLGGVFETVIIEPFSAAGAGASVKLISLPGH